MSKDDQDEQGGVYFLETGDGQFIKIGYSVNVAKRMTDLDHSVPGPRLRPLGFFPASRATEAWLHRKFARLRDKGEWFQSTPEIRQFVENLGLIQPGPARRPRHVRTGTHRCTRCSHGWQQRAPEEGRPKQCPACKSPYWDRPRVRGQQVKELPCPEREPKRFASVVAESSTDDAFDWGA